ncbi:SRPBCC family protein [Nocardia beijingensis]|uniref:SRPBCC family protein n=1 Tax=Nocardia beijingensis TaxID=95162 RepID=A0ABW7WNB8_9NOCA|nr:SRPBCC family protein [Nocardia beijingensis]MBF6075154.1 SRPBCC family protein [Nocardia beijingensis]
MAVDVRTDVVIDRSRELVAAYSADPAHAPAWYSRIHSVTWETEPPLRVGSRMTFVAHFLGGRLTYTYEVVDYTPSVRLVMRTAQGPFPMETTYTWADTPEGGTSMTLRNRGEPKGFRKLAAPVLEAAIRRANRADLARLKELLETG